jgi:hypothetical protein
VAAALVAVPSAAQAAFTARPSAGGSSVASGTVQAVASAAGTCANAGPTATATVSWAASASRTTSYTVAWSGGSTGSTSTTASPATVTGLNKGKPYTFTVTAVFRGWTSPSRTTAAVAC